MRPSACRVWAVTSPTGSPVIPQTYTRSPCATDAADDRLGVLAVHDEVALDVHDGISFGAESMPRQTAIRRMHIADPGHQL